MLFPIHHRHLPHRGKTISLDASITQRNRAPTVPWRKGLLDGSHGEVGCSVPSSGDLKLLETVDLG